MCIETPNWGPCVNSARLLLAWVLAGLATGIVLHLSGNTAYATIAWAAASLPVALHVALGVLRSLLGGRLGVDVIARRWMRPLPPPWSHSWSRVVRPWNPGPRAVRKGR